MSAPLVWIDVETTGLRPGHDQLLEIGCVITDGDLEELAQYSIPIQPSTLDVLNLSPHIVRMHSVNGLLADIREFGVSVWEAQAALHGLFDTWNVNGDVPLAGSSVHFDRGFLKAYMASVESRLHYRNVDISTLKELIARWAPEKAWTEGRDRHRSLEDIIDTLAEARYYREVLGL